MPDDERLGAHSSAGDSNGYGRRHRRAEEPSEQPRRRRRSMEDGPGGLSVADLVQRHGASRRDLPAVTPESHSRRAMPPAGQPGSRRQGEAPGGPQWPDQVPDAPGRRAAPPAPGQATGRRALPDPPPGFGTPEPPAGGRRALPDPPAGLPPTRSTGRRALPDDGFGPAGHHAASDDGFATSRRALPDEGFGPAGQPGGRAVAPGPGQSSGSFAAPPATGRRALPDPAGDPFPRRTAGPGGPEDFGPAGSAFDSGFGGGYDGGYDAGLGAGFDEGFGPGHRAAEGGFGPGQSTGHRPVPDGNFGPGQGTGHRPIPEDFGPGQGTGHRPIPDGGFGPGQGTGHRPIPDGGFGPGQGTGHHAVPDGGFGRPGQGSGPRAMPPGPGQGSGPPALPPGQSSGGRALPPGHLTGRRPVPEEGFSPGQGSGYRAVPPPGPVPGDPASGPNHPSGAFPRDPGRGPNHLSGPIPRDPAAPPMGEEEPRPVPKRPGEGGTKSVPLPPPRAREQDAISMTTEMEAIGDEVQKRRGIDHTLARFSAVHDEIQAEERERKAKRRKLMPWRQDDDEMDQLDELVAAQTIAPQRPQTQREEVPEELVEMLPEGGGPTRLQEKKARRRKLGIRVFAVTAAILVFIATGIAWGLRSWVDASSQQVDALDPNSDAIQDAAKQRGDENFLLVGSDTRAGAEAEDGVGDENEVVGARSDTVMIAHIPADRKRAVVVSFPRDLEVDRPACEGWDPKSGDYTGEQQSAAEQVKLNTAYQVGGPKCVTKLVQQLSGLMINHFVGIDFHGFKGMVDAVRGVELCVERPLKDDVLGMVVPEAGKEVTLSGDQALNFVRARHVQGDVTSDYGRIQRQQRFLSSLLRKAMSTEVLLDPGKLTSFVEALSRSTFGDNIGVDQMITLGQSLQDIEAGRVTFVTVPTVGEANERGNEDLRVEDTNSLFSAIREDTPLPGEKTGTQQLRSDLRLQASGPVDPKTIKLQVLNGGNPTGGIAGDTADQLAEFGYQIVWVDAAPDKVDRTVIKYAEEGAAAAQTLKSSVPDAELVEDPSLVGAVQLIIGPGFDGKVVAPGTDKAADSLPKNLTTINGSDVSCA